MSDVLTPEQVKVHLSAVQDYADNPESAIASWVMLVAHDEALRAERDAALAWKRALRGVAAWLRAEQEVVFFDPSLYLQGWHFGRQAIADRLDAMLDEEKARRG
mgnify:CR=1 FL=1